MEFHRVKNLWQSREYRSKSTGCVVTMPKPVKYYRNSVVNGSPSPQSPKVNGEIAPCLQLDDLTSFYPASSSSTSVSSSSSSVTSMLRTFSDTCAFPTITAKSTSLSELTSPSTLSSSLISVQWRKYLSASDSTPPSSLKGVSFASMSLSSSLGPRQAAVNAIKNVLSVASKFPSSMARGSPYGELVIVDILEAKGLAMDRDETGGALSFHVSLHLGKTSRRTNPTSEDYLAVNERFAFWLPSSPTTDQKTLDIFVHGQDEHNLGEVHLSLAMPLNETFTDSYPLIFRSNGVKRGSMHVGLHRFVLTSSLLLYAAKTLGERESCLKLQDKDQFGKLLLQLWSSFPSCRNQRPAASPATRITGRFIFQFSLNPAPHLRMPVSSLLYLVAVVTGRFSGLSCSFELKSSHPILYAGTFTRDEDFVNGTGKGIYTFKFNTTTGSLTS
ncbi:hypothetical protein PsorP6_005817 [Peronosclerospora sorghi]|uniref:Uncharacterized protein n=1 Tax=Peronosclerospora sorghi TaxID=230839 RepID=A0ACC0W3T1_9STRA|nr:hypothetical protein PsorP6_005817 [Peronosclerospora sorghi]